MGWLNDEKSFGHKKYYTTRSALRASWGVPERLLDDRSLFIESCNPQSCGKEIGPYCGSHEKPLKPLHQGKGEDNIGKIPIAHQGHDLDRFGRLSDCLAASP